MIRNKIVLSILLMVGLVIVTIMIPAMQGSEYQKSKNETNKSAPEATVLTEPEAETATLSLDFIDWDQLKTLFSQKQIESLKEQFPEYLILMDHTQIDSVRFLPEATTYPQDSDLLLQFALSDSSMLPVTYSTEHDSFFFGKEKLQLCTEDLSPEQIEDDKEVKD